MALRVWTPSSLRFVLCCMILEFGFLVWVGGGSVCVGVSEGAGVSLFRVAELGGLFGFIVLQEYSDSWGFSGMCRN